MADQFPTVVVRKPGQPAPNPALEQLLAYFAQAPNTLTPDQQARQDAAPLAKLRGLFEGVMDAGAGFLDPTGPILGGEAPQNVGIGKRIGMTAGALAALLPILAAVTKGGGAALDMSEAARLARAREMGFTTDAYHGTSGSFNRVAIPSWRRSADAGDVGEGFYAAAATNRGAEQAAWYAEQAGSSPNIMPVRLRLQRPLEIARDPNHPLEDPRPMAMRRLSEEWGLSERPKFNGSRQTSQEWASEFSRELQRRGYDGVIVRDRDGGVMEYMVPDPKQIRSRFARFDPREADSDLLLAGAAPVGVGLAHDRERH